MKLFNLKKRLSPLNPGFPQSEEIPKCPPIRMISENKKYNKEHRLRKRQIRNVQSWAENISILNLSIARRDAPSYKGPELSEKN